MILCGHDTELCKKTIAIKIELCKKTIAIKIELCYDFAKYDMKLMVGGS